MFRPTAQTGRASAEKMDCIVLLQNLLRGFFSRLVELKFEDIDGIWHLQGYVETVMEGLPFCLHVGTYANHQ